MDNLRNTFVTWSKMLVLGILFLFSITLDTFINLHRYVKIKKNAIELCAMIKETPCLFFKNIIWERLPRQVFYKDGKALFYFALTCAGTCAVLNWLFLRSLRKPKWQSDGENVPTSTATNKVNLKWLSQLRPSSKTIWRQTGKSSAHSRRELSEKRERYIYICVCKRLFAHYREKCARETHTFCICLEAVQ